MAIGDVMVKMRAWGRFSECCGMQAAHGQGSRTVPRFAW